MGARASMFGKQVVIYILYEKWLRKWPMVVNDSAIRRIQSAKENARGRMTSEGAVPSDLMADS